METTPDQASTRIKGLKVNPAQKPVAMKLKPSRSIKSRLVPGGRDFFTIANPITGETNAKDTRKLTADILNLMRGCGQFLNFKFYLCDPDIVDKVPQSRSCIKDFPPVRGNPYAWWDQTTTAKETLASAMATMLERYKFILYFEINEDGLWMYADQDKEFGPDAETFQPQVSWRPRRVKPTAFNAHQETQSSVRAN